jgi:hypothetical protein
VVSYCQSYDTNCFMLYKFIILVFEWLEGLQSSQAHRILNSFYLYKTSRSRFFFITKSRSCIKGRSIIQIPLSGRTNLAESFHEKMSSFVNVVKAYLCQWKKSVLPSIWKNSIGAKFRVMIDIEGRLSLFSIPPQRRFKGATSTNHIIAMVRLNQLEGSGSFTCSYDFYLP